MNILCLILTVLYSLMNTIISIIGFKSQKTTLSSSSLMFLGGFLTFLSIFLTNYSIFFLIIGLILIHISAINNGLKLYGKINPKHHIIRLVFSLLLIILYIKF